MVHNIFLDTSFTQKSNRGIYSTLKSEKFGVCLIGSIMEKPHHQKHHKTHRPKHKGEGQTDENLPTGDVYLPASVRNIFTGQQIKGQIMYPAGYQSHIISKQRLDTLQRAE